MRAFFITACVLSLIYTVVAFALVQEVESARNRAFDEYLYNSLSYDDDYNSYSSYSYADQYEDEADGYTITAGIISVLYMIISVVVFLLALLRVKTKTMKVIAIIGLSLSGLFMLWAFLPMASPSAVSFNEIGPAFILAGLALLAFHIVGMIQAFRVKA